MFRFYGTGTPDLAVRPTHFPQRHKRFWSRRCEPRRTRHRRALRHALCGVPTELGPDAQAVIASGSWAPAAALPAGFFGFTFAIPSKTARSTPLLVTPFLTALLTAFSTFFAAFFLEPLLAIRAPLSAVGLASGNCTWGPSRTCPRIAAHADRGSQTVLSDRLLCSK